MCDYGFCNGDSFGRLQRSATFAAIKGILKILMLALGTFHGLSSLYCHWKKEYQFHRKESNRGAD
jgi:hypothetical protein